MNTETYYQTGDVLYFKVASIPKTAKAIKGDLVWKGQNHHHRAKGKFKIRKDTNTIYLDVTKCTMVHEEHKPIKLPKGEYKIKIVQEYSHWDEESKAVID